MFVGEKKIKGILEEKDGKVKIGFKDGSADIVMNKNLFDIIKSDEKGKGLVTDHVRHVLSTKFLLDMSDYGLDIGMVDHIGIGMKTLAHNMREDLIRKTFDCNGADNITLKQLIE